MERLTYKLGEHYGLSEKASARPRLFTDYDGFFAYLTAVNKLGKYEDTGFTPEEVQNLVEKKQRIEELLTLTINYIPKQCDTCKYWVGVPPMNCLVGGCSDFKKHENWQWIHAHRLEEKNK